MPSVPYRRAGSLPRRLPQDLADLLTLPLRAHVGSQLLPDPKELGDALLVGRHAGNLLDDFPRHLGLLGQVPLPMRRLGLELFLRGLVALVETHRDSSGHGAARVAPDPLHKSSRATPVANASSSFTRSLRPPH